MSGRTLTLRGTTYPVILPNIRDPRLHVAAVIVTVHVLGQVGLHFWVSVPQILAAILTCAVIEVALTFRQSRAIVWPASAMLTGSGVALIMRVVGTAPDDHWTFDSWYVFAAVAGLSLLTKYVIRYRGSHVFNPSNVGLVVAFVVLGTTRIEPLDFWWAPLNGSMLAAYAVIGIGGLLITRRLRLLALAAAFWVTLAVAFGTLTASGHCIVTRWAFEPVCGFDLWRVIVTSPEVLVFLFFMITDPKTVPSGRVGRVAFGILVAIVCTLLMAPQTDEFGTKVGLLAGLVVMCAARPLLDRVVPVANDAADGLRSFGSRLVLGNPGSATLTRVARVALAVAAVPVLGVGIVLAGGPARGTVAAGAAEVTDRLPSQVDPATFPSITVDVQAWTGTFDSGPITKELLVTLAAALDVEDRALLTGDAGLLATVDHGDRLREMQAQLQAAQASGRTVIDHYRFDSVRFIAIAPFGVQTGGSIGLVSHGTVTEETYGPGGALLGRTTATFDLTFALRRPTGDRWLLVAVLPTPPGG